MTPASLAALLAALAGLAAAAAVLLFVRLRRVQAQLRALGERAAAQGAQQDRSREARRRLQLLLDHMPDGVLAFDAGGRIEWINPAARLMFQHGAEEVVGQPVARLIPQIGWLEVPPQPPLAPSMVAAPTPRIVTRGRRRDGSDFPLELAMVELHGGDARATMCVCRDVSDVERMEQMKSEFVSMVSHELRTPLTSLRGSLALLTDGTVTDPADQARMLRLASLNSERLVMLVNDILDFERLRAGALKIEPEDLELSEVLARAVESVEGMARQLGVAVVLQAGGDALPVRADPTRLLQVLVNLLSNAIKYSPSPGRVEIGAARRGEHVRAWVRDHGPGVPAEFVPRLFLPFEQARDPRHRKQGGTGLGLAISRALMETMHGSIGHERPRDGPGAVFWIELPLHSARPSTFGDFDDEPER